VPALGKQAFDELCARGCGACGRNYLKVRALAGARVDVMEGDAVSPLAWTYAPEALAERVYRVECAECGVVLFERDDCPLCKSPSQLARAIGAQNGVAPPRECTHCGYAELTLTVEARLRVETILGRVSRRVAEAEAHEPGFHVVEAHCRSCEQLTASAGDARCVACGRSRLLRRMM
jgi:hypothetical protein